MRTETETRWIVLGADGRHVSLGPNRAKRSGSVGRQRRPSHISASAPPRQKLTCQYAGLRHQ
jgi:hypothetical protein